VDTLAEAGFASEQLSQLIATGAYDLDWASVVFPEPDRSADHHAGGDGGRHRPAGGAGGTPL
jgi:hypothetical protein